MTQRYTNGAAHAPTHNGRGAPSPGNHPSGRGRRRPTKERPSAQPPAVVIPPAPPPVATFQTGAVETCVWMNPTSNPAYPGVWTVTQSRLYPAGGETAHARSFRSADLAAARWGLYLAHRWIRRTERRGAVRSLFGR